MTVRPPASQKWPVIPAQGFAVAAMAKAVGVDPRPIFAEAGVDETLLDRHAPVIAESDLPNFVAAIRGLVGAIEEEAARQSGSGAPHPYQYDLLWFATAGCVLLTNVLGMIPVFADVLGSRMQGISAGTSGDGWLAISLADRPADGSPVEFLADFLRLIAFERMLSWFSGVHLSGLRFEFREPAHFAAFIPAGLTGRDIGWSARHTRILMPASVGARPVVRSAAEFAAIFPITPLLLGETPASPYASATSRAIDDAIAAGRDIPDLATIARETKCSIATVRRRLAEEGTSLQILKNDRRHAWAIIMLQDERLSIGEIGNRLGFSDEATFRRAFKQWAGVPPSRLKAANRR